MNDKLKILILDDDPDVLELLSGVLNEKYIVETGVNGLEGFEKFKVNDFHFILSDIQMPKTSGIEFAKKVREVNKTPILFITASTNEYTAEIGSIENSLFLQKPFKIKELNLKIQEIETMI